MQLCSGETTYSSARVELFSYLASSDECATGAVLLGYSVQGLPIEYTLGLVCTLTTETYKGTAAAASGWARLIILGANILVRSRHE